MRTVALALPCSPEHGMNMLRKKTVEKPFSLSETLSHEVYYLLCVHQVMLCIPKTMHVDKCSAYKRCLTVFFFFSHSMIAVNSTHITAGHEVRVGTRYVLRTEGFAVCSNGELCTDLSDRTVCTKTCVQLLHTGSLVCVCVRACVRACL